MGQNFKRVIKNWDICIASLMLLLLVALTFSGVIMRYIVGKPYTWLEEVQLFCMVWIVFCAGGAAFRTGNHVAIEVLVDSFSRKIQRGIQVIIDFAVLATLSYLCLQSVGYVRLFISSGRLTSMLRIPYWLIYGIVPVALVSMIANCLYTVHFHRKTKIEQEGGV